MLSIIIPTYNEEKSLGRTLESLRNPRLNTEIIVVDGGSSDMTHLVANSAGTKWICCEKGAAHQMNTGAQEARGKVLLFLHADSVMQAGWDLALRQVIRDGHPWGAFTFAIDSERLVYRVIEFGVGARTIILDMPFGDQGIFVRKQLFLDVGGYREMPVMEDLDLVRRLKRLHAPIYLEQTLSTSPRHWEEEGIVKRTLRNWRVQVGSGLRSAGFRRYSTSSNRGLK